MCMNIHVDVAVYVCRGTKLISGTFVYLFSLFRVSHSNLELIDMPSMAIFVIFDPPVSCIAGWNYMQVITPT